MWALEFLLEAVLGTNNTRHEMRRHDPVFSFKVALGIIFAITFFTAITKFIGFSLPI